MTVGSVEINDNVQSQLYFKYKDYGIIPLAVPATVICVLIAGLGHLGKYVMNLHGSCNILLAITSLADILHMTAPFTLGYFVFSGQNFASIYTCLKVQTVPIIGILFGMQLIMFIALDRFFCVLLPIQYRLIKKRVYIASYLVLCLPFVIFILYDAYKMAWVHKNQQVICLVVEGLYPTTLGLMFQCQISMNIVTVGCYVGVWFCQKYRTNLRSETSNRILKSVCAITLVLVLGWTVNAILQIVFNTLLKLPQEKAFFVELYCGIGPTLACSINYVVLFAFSKDYRTAFKNQFCFEGKTRVTAFLTDTAIQRPTVTSSRAPSNI
ncbi:serpentine type 7TM GPCR chemoreceptor srsx domain-containing protein [Ditylenchus destructor]|uniref:Serpentine type 7TM GPCR chemoreceptor srsx domain-containing protein n=1 Tax=Ditylenchus destructor TaxID=166010 RepID=A0AAD4MRH8_9BILA|nr:serpentine type 7TM GPCR chemoreceptor srsx domain-containing protein [Ditylenchus destructor]